MLSFILNPKTIYMLAFLFAVNKEVLASKEKDGVMVTFDCGNFDVFSNDQLDEALESPIVFSGSLDTDISGTDRNCFYYGGIFKDKVFCKPDDNNKPKNSIHLIFKNTELSNDFCASYYTARSKSRS